MELNGKDLHTITHAMFLWCHQVNQVVIIQRAWRAHKARLDLRSITHQENPPMPVIRKFIHLLDVSPGDLDEEFRLQVFGLIMNSLCMTLGVSFLIIRYYCANTYLVVLIGLDILDHHTNAQ